MKYNEEMIIYMRDTSEFKNLKESRNKLIAKKEILEGSIKQLGKDLEHLKKQQMLTPVKSIKTPRNSIWSISKIKLFETMTSLEAEPYENPQPLTEVDYDSIIDDLETKISVTKKENTEFFVFIDELNDSSFSSEKQNSFLKSGLKSIDKQIADLIKEKNSLTKLYEKHNISNPKSGTFIELDLNMKSLDKVCQQNLSADIISFLNK